MNSFNKSAINIYAETAIVKFIFSNRKTRISSSFMLRQLSYKGYRCESRKQLLNVGSLKKFKLR